MAWITITVGDLKDRKVAALVEALQSAALGSGQSDPTPNIIASVTARIRAEIKGCARNQLDRDTTTVPADLTDLAVRMVLRVMKDRLEIPLTEDERNQMKSDERYLERIAACDVPVATPDDAVDGDVQSGSVSPKTYAPQRDFSSEEQEGL